MSAAEKLVAREPRVDFMRCPACGSDHLIGRDSVTTNYRVLTIDGEPQFYAEYDDGVSAEVRDAYDDDATYDEDETIECRDCDWPRT